MNFKNVALSLTVALSFVSSFGLAQASANLYVDNDCGISNCFSDSSGGTPYFTEYPDNTTASANHNYELSRNDLAHAYYHWTVITGDSATHLWNLSVNLNNVSFTNSTARYYMDGTWVGTINQKTAIGGNNWIGHMNDYGTIKITVDQHDDNSSSTSTGADEVNLWW